jgi:hypothetical protein
MKHAKYLISAAALAACCLFQAGPARAEGEADKRVLDALDSEDIKHEVEDNGEISVVISWSNDAGRSQAVRIQSKTFSWGNNEYRDIYSIAFKTDKSNLVERALANRLLSENNQSTLGFWATQDDTVFSIARLPAKATPSMLREAIFFVAEKADDLEKELLKTDDF